MLTISQAISQAIEFHRRGNLDRAEQLYRQVLAADARHADAWHLLGLIAHARGEGAKALEHIGHAIELDPRQPSFYNHQSEVYRTLARLDEAEESCRQALRLNGDFVAAHNALGMVQNRQGRFTEAESSFRRALEIDPGFAAAHANLSMSLQGLGRFDEALAVCEYALSLEQRATDFRESGRILREQGKLAEAAKLFDKAARSQPDPALVHNNRALVLLLMGDFERGWPEYEWRWRMPGASPRPQSGGPEWDGSPLEGRSILLYPEQGHGDMFQFIRYAPLVQACGGRVLVGCPPRMVRILSSCAGVDSFYSQATPPPFDTHAALMSLPRIFKTDLESIPADVPYLSAEPDRIERWGKFLGDDGRLRVGINWQGSTTFLWDHHRSMPLREFGPLGEVEGVRLVSLQKGTGEEQLADAPFAVEQLGDEVDADASFCDTAAVIMNLDLVITSDTAMAHLAGALGVPVWLALNLSPDWRWLLEREDSPWYPTMRLFRQTQLGDWPGVFQRMAAELNTLVARK